MFFPSEPDINKKGYILAHFNFSAFIPKESYNITSISPIPWGPPKNSIITGLDNQGFKKTEIISIVIKSFENTVIFHVKTKKIKGKLYFTYPNQDEVPFLYTVSNTWC